MCDNEVYAYFSISDFECGIGEITALTKVEPTTSWKKGDVDDYFRERRFSRWSLSSRLPKSKELELHIEDVLLQMDKNPEEFRSLSEKFAGQMQLVGYFYQDYPGLNLGTHLIEKLGYYKLCLDCDFYYLYSTKREDTY